MQDNRTIPISFKSPLSREFFYEHIIKKIQSLKCKGAHMPSKTKTSWRKEEKKTKKKPGSKRKATRYDGNKEVSRSSEKSEI